MATWLITGASGFLGGHLMDALERERKRNARAGDRVVVLGRSRPAGCPPSSFVSADLNDPVAIDAAVREIEPDYVLHTAGKTPPATDDEMYRANFWTTTRLMKALRSSPHPVRVVLAGSAAEYGPVKDEELPVGEDYPCLPMTSYGRSKLMTTISALAEKPPIEVVVARLFNPIGPGLPESQAFGRFAAQLLSTNADPLPVTVGRLDARRDFVDVRDAADALVALALKGRAGAIYNIGAGRSRTVREGLDSLVRLSGREVRVEVDPNLIGRREPADSRARIDRALTDAGWRPTISFERSIEDLWEAAKARSQTLSMPRGDAPLPLTG